MSHDVPDRVLDAYGFVSDAVEPLPGGLINHTYLVRGPLGPRAVLQRLHPIFAAEVNIDLDAVTAHLGEAGLVSPRLVRTLEGARWIEEKGRVWRALTYIEGVTIHRIEHPAWAHAAAELVGRFHRAVSNLEHVYVFARAGVHDTAAHLGKLERLLAGQVAGTDEIGEQAQALGREILALARDLPLWGTIRRRHTHGDLKISNVLFARGDVPSGLCLLDLDTLGLQSMAYELGDALRSWCNPAGEDVLEAELDERIFAAAMDGYRTGAGDLLEAGERTAIVPGIETVCVELAARFCADVFEDAYFGWNAGRYGSRREHNLVRARGQLALARSVRRKRALLARLVA